MSDALAAYDLAVDLLAVAADALDTLPLLDPDLRGAPTHQYVSAGLPAIDCEQVSAHVPALYEAGTWTPQGPASLAEVARIRLGQVSEVAVAIIVARCVVGPQESGSTIVLPSVAQLEADGKQVSADGWAIWQGLQTARRNGRLGDCASMMINPAVALNPSGNFAGWTLTVQKPVDGYTVEIGS